MKEQKKTIKFYTEEEKKLIASSLSKLQDKRSVTLAIYELTKKLKRKYNSIYTVYKKMQKDKIVNQYATKTLNLGKGTVLNFPVNRAVLEDGKITLYFD